MVTDTKNIRPSHFRLRGRADATPSIRRSVRRGLTSVRRPSSHHEFRTSRPTVGSLCPFASWSSATSFRCCCAVPMSTDVARRWVCCAMRSRVIICMSRTRQDPVESLLSPGVGLCPWTLGDVFLTIESLWENASVPSLADAVLHGFYPLSTSDGAALASAMGGSRDPNGSTASSRDSAGRRLRRLCVP